MKRCLPAISLFWAMGAAALVAADPPAWWSASETRVVDPNAAPSNYSPVLAGQLKHVAKQAKKHLDANVVGGAGTPVNSLVAGFSNSAQTAYKPVNLGQLKAVAKPFYDRLIAAGYDTKANLIARGYPANWSSNYPWKTTTAIAENYKTANLGQLKMVFSFDLHNLDSDGDGLPNGWEAWEQQHFGHPGVDPSADEDGDGLTNLQEYQNRTDPEDFYNGLPPVLTIADGDNQGHFANQPLARPLAARLSNHLGMPEPNAAVAFSLTQGGGQLTPLAGGITDAEGIARASLALPATVGTILKVKAAFGSAAVIFTASVGNPNVAPAAPGRPVVTQEHGATEARVEWEDRSNNETAFYVERSTYGEPWTRVAELSANAISCTVTGLVPDKVYYFRVIAHNTAP